MQHCCYALQLLRQSERGGQKGTLKWFLSYLRPLPTEQYTKNCAPSVLRLTTVVCQKGKGYGLSERIGELK